MANLILRLSGTNVAGDESLNWEVSVYRGESQLCLPYYAVASVGTRIMTGVYHGSPDGAKDEGCSMVADMVAELEDAINA